jgi:hypothetical protein
MPLECSVYCVRFQVLMTAYMKMTASWDIALCSLEVDHTDDGDSMHH